MNQSLQISGCQEVAMISNVYPVPIPVTRAKVELVIDQTAKATAETIAADEQAVLVSVRRVLESYESSVIQEWWPDSRRGHRCGRAKTAPVTTAASCDIRAI